MKIIIALLDLKELEIRLISILFIFIEAKNKLEINKYRIN